MHVCWTLMPAGGRMHVSCSRVCEGRGGAIYMSTPLRTGLRVDDTTATPACGAYPFPRAASSSTVARMMRLLVSAGRCSTQS